LKKNKVTYEDVARKLFNHGFFYFLDGRGEIESIGDNISYILDPNNACSEKQLKKLLAINQLMNVVKYLNADWEPNWYNDEEGKYYFQINYISKNLHIDCTGSFNHSIVYFKSERLARQAIEILGEETIRLALCTDY